MGKLIRIYVDSLKQEYINKRLENGELFLYCKENIEDDQDTYCRKGKLYPVIGDTGDIQIMEGDNCMVSVEKGDPQVVLVAIEGGEK